MTDFEKYFEALQAQQIDEITEHSHRTHLQQLLESIAGENIKILHKPKREGKFGAPDFKIMHTESIIGYLENKKIEENLDKILKTEQIKKYQSLSDNILITNYIDWIWLKEGKIQARETLCFLTEVTDKRKKLDPLKVSAVRGLIGSFFSQAPKEISDAKKLAEALAIRARILKDFLHDELKRQENERIDGRLYHLYETFKDYIFQELSIEEFADTFAQNLACGLFLAKLNADNQAVNLYNAKKFIPTSFELIRELVNFLDELDNEEYRQTKWIVEEVLNMMNRLDLRAIQETLSYTHKRKDANNLTIKDPYIYFYEDFLAAYDQKLRKAKGVYYTPSPVVNFIVRAIDEVLVNTFQIEEGLADHNQVTVLDFATGTGTFLIEILQQILEKLPKDSGKKELLIKEHILKNIFGFEYLIAPYTIAHLKLSQFLKDNGYELKSKERLQVYLTNTLEPISSQIRIPFLPALTEESRKAQQIKEKPILVITGNPPYAYHSKNKGKWILQKMQTYYFVDGEKIKERNPKGLQDDYVKFIRFAQDKIDAVEEGIVGIITNHTFLLNPTFLGMRQSLMNTFNQMYFINLHGNAKMKEKTLEGGRDENIFDIEQGVAISLFIKKKGLPTKIFYTDFYGTRKAKYARCSEENINSIQWQEFVPESPLYLFQEISSASKNNYNRFWSINDIFQIKSSGITTHRDYFVYAFDKTELRKRISDLKNEGISNEKIMEKYQLENSPTFSLNKKREDLRKLKEEDMFYQVCQYRPFDDRVLFFHEILIDRPRKEIMLSIQDNNIALVSGRAGRVVGGSEWNLSFVTDKISDTNLFYRGGAVVFPLYILSNGIEKIFFGNQVSEPQIEYGEQNGKYRKEENFTANFRKYIDEYYQCHLSPQEIFGYLYAVLYSPSYRQRYAELLKIDFPKIPFTEDKYIFQQLSDLGKQLIDCHLLKKKRLDSLGNFIGKGNNIVEKIDYVVENQIGRVYINENQYFNNVSEEVFNFVIGGYPVLKKLLKERKDRNILLEIEQIEQTIRALAHTIELMKEIDTLTSSWV